MVYIEEQILLIATSIYDAMGWPGVIFLMAIESANIPFPSEIIMPLSGWLLIQDKGLPPYYLLLAGFCGALGNLIGSILSYWVGAIGGRPFLYRFGKYLLISRKDLAMAEDWFSKHGDAAIFFSRLLPVVRTFISFPAGIVKMNFLKFCIYTFIGAFIWSIGLAYGGYVLGSNWEDLRTFMRPFDIPILILIVLGIGYYFYRQYKHIKDEG